MDKPALLAELRALADNVPDFDAYTPTSRPHLEWLGKTHALIAQHDEFAAVSFRSSSDLLSSVLFRASCVAQLLNTLHRAVADLELAVGAGPAGAFGPGAVYDFMRSLRDLLSSVKSDVLIVDPYMNADIFDAFVTAVSPSARVRLLLRTSDGSFKPALDAYVRQHTARIESRQSQALHDRVVFLDMKSCWVLGQSIKDAAKKKPTYLAPLQSDIALLKMEGYEAIWTAARVL